MDLQHIPRTFWHALSVAVLVLSIGLTYIAYRSSSVSIDLFNAKIELSSEVASSTVALNNALNEAKSARQLAQKKYEILLRVNETLQRQIEALKEKANTSKSAKATLENLESDCPDCVQIKPMVKNLSFESFDENIQKAEASLQRLEELNKQIQPMQ